MARVDKTIADSAEQSAGSTAMVDEIVNFVETQKSSADEILASIRSISGMVESNAASAQENAAISTSLGECAESLMDTVAQFRLKKSQHTAAQAAGRVSWYGGEEDTGRG